MSSLPPSHPPPVTVQEARKLTEQGLIESKAMTEIRNSYLLSNNIDRQIKDTAKTGKSQVKLNLEWFYEHYNGRIGRYILEEFVLYEVLKQDYAGFVVSNECQNGGHHRSFVLNWAEPL